MQMREKVGKSRNTVFFPMICGSGGSKGRLAKAAGAEPSGQMRDDKLHAVVARSTFPSQNVQNTPGPIHFCEKVHAVVARSTFGSQMYKAHHSRTTFGSWDVEKVHGVGARSTFPRQHAKSTTCSDRFWVFRCRFAWQAQGIVHSVKVSKTWGCCGMFKNDGKRGTFEENLKKIFILHNKGSIIDMFIRDVRRSGRWFPEKGCISEHQIFRFAKMILCDRYSTSYDLASLLRGRRNTLHRWSCKIAKRIDTRPSALHSTFDFWRTSRKICFVFDVANFENWGSLAELLCVWRCQVQTLRASRRIAALSMLWS